MRAMPKSEGKYTCNILWLPMWRFLATFNVYPCNLFWFQVVILTKSGAIMDAVSVLAAALLPKSPHFVKKLKFSQEVVRQVFCFFIKTTHSNKSNEIKSSQWCHILHYILVYLWLSGQRSDYIALNSLKVEVSGPEKIIFFLLMINISYLWWIRLCFHKEFVLIDTCNIACYI